MPLMYPISNDEDLGGFLFFVIKNNDATYILVHNLGRLPLAFSTAEAKMSTQH